ncbi:MAG: hypothetical protein Q7T96_14365 [Methylobacter sp.]|nr:hypothetical protein [Methylobacter sp.]
MSIDWHWVDLATVKSVPLIILTACDEVNDRINGIEQNDMTMPFELRKLGIRARALIRLCYGGFSNVA